MNEKYHITEDLKDSYDKGRNNVKQFFAEGNAQKQFKEGYDSTVQWFKDNHVVEKTTQVNKGIRELHLGC